MGKSIRVKKGDEVLEIQDSDLQAAVNDGYLPTERIVVANSKTKETYEIDPQDLPDALKDGFSFSDVKKKSVGQGLPMAGKAISAIGSSQSNGEVLEEGQNNTGGASSFFGGVQQSGQSQKDKVTNYLQSLKEPQKQTIEGGLTISKKLPQVSNPFTQTREEAFEKSSGKLMDIMYKEGSDWHDPIKATHEGISKAKDTKEAVEYLGAKGLVEQSLAPDGFEALKTLQSYDFGLDAGNNITAKMLKERADKYLATTQPFRDLQFQSGEGITNDPMADYNSKEKFYDAAMRAYGEKNPNFKAQMEVAGVPNIEQNEKRGQIVDMMLNDPDFIAFATKENPSLIPLAQKVQQDLYEDNKDYAVNQIANKVSRQMQKEGYNDIDPIFNFAGENAKEVADLTAKTSLTPEEYKIYQERNVFEKLDMPSFFEGFASAGKDMGKGILNTFTQSFNSVPESIKEGWVKEASHVSADPTGFTKFLRDTGHATGFVASIGAGGALGTGVGLTSQTAGAVTTALSFFGDQLEQGRMKYPNSPVKAFTSAATNTAMYSALSYQLFPATKVKQAFARIEPSVAKIVDNLTKGTISREAARAEINTLWKQGIDWLSTGLKKNIKVSAEMAGIAQLNRGLDKLMGMDDQTFEQYHPEGEVEDTAVSMFMSNILVNSLAARGDIRAKNNMAKEAIWQAANYPNRYRSVIEGMEIRGEIKSAKEMLDNLDFLVQTKSELQGKTEKQQKDYLINALQQKVLNESKPKSPDGTLTRQHSDRIKNLEEINQGILEGKDADEIVTTQEQKQLDEQQKQKDEIEKNTIESERLTKAKELDEKEFAEKRAALDGRRQEDRIKIEKLEQAQKEKNEDYDNKLAKLMKQKGELLMKQGKTDATFLKEQSLDAPSGLKAQLGSDKAVIEVIAQNEPAEIEAAIKKWEDRIRDEFVTAEDADKHISLLEKGLELAQSKTIDQQRELDMGDEISQPIELSTKIPGDEGYVAPESPTPKEEVTKPVSEKSFEERTDKEHATYIKDKFVEEFTKKGVPKEQVLAATALMDARAKSWASEEKGRTPEQWFERITDVKSGEFQDAVSDIKYQGEWKKVLIAAALAIKPLQIADTIKTPTKQEVVQTGGVKQKEVIKKLVEEYFEVNGEKAPTDVINRAIQLWDIYNKPEILSDSTAKDERAYTSGNTEAIPTSNPDLTVVVSVKGVTIGNITNFDDFIAEISHAAQYRSGGILNQRNYKYQEDRDKYEYERRGSLEYDAHKLIEPYLAKYVLTGKKGDSLIVETIKTIPKNIVDELMPTLQKYNIKFQLNKGAVEMLKDGRMIIHALDAPDFSTMVHEIAHVFESDLTKAEQKIVKDFGGSEVFARGFERYLRNGIAPSKELASLFQKFRKWMMDIYKSFVGTPIEKRISPEIKKIFDRLLTEQKTKPVSEVKPEPKEIKLPEPPENYNIVNETNQASDKGNERKPTEKEVVAESEVKEDSSGAGQEPPKTPPAEPVEGASEGKDKLNEKGILNRLYKAKNVPESAKKGFEEKGLKYQVQSQPEAQELAKGIVNEFGIEEAVTLAEANRFKGGVRSAIFAESLTRLTEEGEAAKTPEDKLRLAADFKDMAIRYDEFARGQGQDISQINYFYKKSPLGIVMYENAKRKGDFDTWSKPKDQEWKSFFDEMMKEPEFEAVVKEQVKESLKQERAEARKNRIKKVDEFFDKAKDQFKGGAAYSTIIPPKVITTALEGMKQAYRAGEKVAKLVQDAIDYITTELGNAPWDKEKFRKEWEDKLKDKSGKAPLTDAELKAKVLDRFRKKLKGLTEKQKDEVIRRAHRKLIENDALDYQDFRDIISQVVGRGDLTPEQVAQMKTMVAKLNAVETAAQRARDERTEAARIDYRRAEIEAGKASRDLNNLFYNKPDIIKRLTSIMQLNTLGIPSLVNNPVYNIWNQATLRFPVGLINDLADRGISLAAKAAGKNYDREYNVLGTQAEFWSKLGLGTKESMQQLWTGLNRQDYLQKEIYGQQIRPMSAMKDLISYAKGEKTFSKPQLMDKAIQATAGVPAEIVARLLNIGDKPQRFAAEGSQAAAFAKTLGLADMDYKLFIDFPREEAYRAYKAQGLSDEVAGQKADYIKEAIIKEGQRSTFQQDNILNDVINAAVNKIESKVGANKDSGTGVLLKTLTISPYIKIPSNAFWSFYNLLNPEVAILQTGVHAARSKQLSKKGEITKSKLQQREARYWMAHAIVGMGMRAVVLALVKQGIFTPASDDEESKKERDAISYFDKAGTVQVGDMKISNRWFGQWGMMGNAIAKKYRDATPEQRENQDEFWNIVFGDMEVEGLKELQNGIFANSSSLLQSMDTGNPDRYLTNTLNMFANIIQPASVAQINRASLDEVPSTRGDNFLDKLNTNFAQRSTLYRKLFNVQIDSKRDIWGQTVPKGGNTLSRMFGISKANPQIFARPVYDDYLRTSDSGFLPPAVLPILEGTKLNTKQYIRLQEYVGRERKRLVEPYVNDMAMIPNFGLYSTLKDDEVKKEALSYLYTKGRELGVEKFYTDFPELRPKEKTEEEIEKDRNIKSMKKEMKGSFE